MLAAGGAPTWLQGGSGKGGTIVSGLYGKMFELQALCWEAVYSPDASTFVAPLAALVGPEEVQRLEHEAHIAREVTQGLKSYAHGDAYDTVTVLMLRLLNDLGWAERMVAAYRTVIREGLDTVGVDVRDPDDEWVVPIEMPLGSAGRRS
jgi:hypothetical protein